MKLLFATVLCLAYLLPITTQARNAAPWVGVDLNGVPCNGGEQGYGPWDYTKADERSNIPVVEQHHFTPEVENHIKGKSGYLVTDLDYTLRAVPNHPKALLSIIRYQEKQNKKLLKNPMPLASPVECYLQRAIHFSPEDVSSYSLFAYYLKESGNPEKAAKAYQKALTISPNNAKLAYSYSLFLIEQKQYDKALEHAKKAYAHGKPPESLKNKLIKLGVWKEAADK